MPGAVITPGAIVTAVLAVLAVVALVGLAVAVGLRRRRSGPDPESITAEPEDRPLPAVVANPIRLLPGTRDLVAAVCLDLGWRYPLWLETTLADPGAGQARTAVERGADVVLACGGDGTVRSVAEGLAGTRVALGLLPAGTGNLLARNLGTPLDLPAATRVALTGDDRAIDVGWLRVDGAMPERAFLVMAGAGMDATIMAATPEALKARVGPLAYLISGMRALKGQQARVTLCLDDGVALRRRTRTVVVGNCGTLFGGLVLMPAARVDDGLLDVVSVAPRGLAGWFGVAVRVITRRRRGHARVEHWQARSVVLASDAPQLAQIDGDPIGDATELRLRVERAALVVRVPAARRTVPGG